MQKQFVLAVVATILGGAVWAPHSEAGPVRRVIMVKSMQKKQQQKQQQQQQSGTSSTTAGTKPAATGTAGTTNTAK